MKNNSQGNEGERAKLFKGQRVRLAISSMTPSGAAISKDLGVPVFVERAAPGDVIDAELFDVRKDFARGSIVDVIEPSSVRAEPPCGLFKVCGGCQWQHMSYEGQLEAKTDIVRQALRHIGGQNEDVVRPTIGAKNPLFYRNKVQYPVKNPQNSMRILAGYYQQDSHKLVNIKHCPVQPEPLDRMLEAVKNACENNNIIAYDEKTGKGALRHINARISNASNDVLVTLVVNSATLSKKPFLERGLGKAVQAAAKEIMEAVAEIKGVCVNLNERAGNKILGEETICLAGKNYIEEELKTNRPDLPALLRSGLRFRLSPTSFFQVNTQQAITILEQVADAVLNETNALGRKPLLIDAYAGVGAISLWLSPLCQTVIAVEEHDQAVEDGCDNTELNAIENVEFKLGAVEDVLPQLKRENVSPDVIVIDPPRKGMSQAALNSVLTLAAPVVIYISCNPSTLARDLKTLAQGMPIDEGEQKGRIIGYKTKQVQPVDLFPQTYHVESVTILERFISDGTVGNMETA